MPTVSGYTSFGIIRKRMADLYSDFATRIKEGGVFGTQTTADLPDVFPTDPLVQIMATTAGSIHEVWEAVELWYSQLDPRTASGAYLEYMHGTRMGIARASGQSDSDYRAAILAAFARPTRTDITTVASARPDVDCAVLLSSTVSAPIEGIPAPGNALVLRSCSAVIDYDALALDIYNTIELGLHEFYGEATGVARPASGGCIPYKFMRASPMFVALELVGYYSDGCLETTRSGVAAVAVERLNSVFAACELGVQVSVALLLPLLTSIPGFIATDIRVGRRARLLIGEGCAVEDAPTVTLCGVETPWVSSIVCGKDAGETWCAPQDTCLNLLPWEFAAFDEQFVTVTLDPTKGGCA